MVKYAGLIQDIRGDFDPSGRTDLLKILDRAKLDGKIVPFGSTKQFEADAILKISDSVVSITAKSNQELLLRVSIHWIASIGLVREGYENILPIKIGDTSANADLFDLAVVYCLKTEVAADICNYLGQCFSRVYKEAAGNFDLKPSLTDSHQDLRHAGTVTTPSRSESMDGRSDELIKDYMSKLTACLSAEELAQYAKLIVRWRDGSMPLCELALKLTELYGPERQHLLTGRLFQKVLAFYWKILKEFFFGLME
uniref:CCM2_C domain-containing protein n=1 Tax=Syphacia muris TaxID=451379 RepID=A0A0N5ARY0_9BILA